MDRRRELRLERLLGQRVYDPDGRVVGRLEEFRAEREGEHYVVTEFLVGTAALLERLSVGRAGILRKGRHKGFRVRWNQLDIDDPTRPTLTCPVEDLTVA